MFSALYRTFWITIFVVMSAATTLHAQVQDDVVQAEAEQIMLRTRLYNFAEEYGVLMQETVDGLRGKDVASDTWLELLGWSYRSVIYFRRSPYTINPHVALADNLVLITRTNHYLATDAARDDFGKAYADVQQAMKDASVLIWQLAAQEMDPDDLEAVYTEIEAWAKDNPVNAYLSYQYPVAMAADDKLIANLEQAAPDFFLGNLESTVDNAVSEIKILQLQVARLSDFIEQSPIYATWLAESVLVGRMQGASVADAVDTVASLDGILSEVEDAAGRIDDFLSDIDTPEDIAEEMGATFLVQTRNMLIQVVLVFFACLLVYRLLTCRLNKR